MLAGSQQVDPDVVHQRRVRGAVDRRVNQRGRAAPVFVFRVRIEDLRQQIGRARVRQQTVGDAALRIALGQIGEGKDVGRIEEVQVRMAVARRLREPMVEAAAAGAGDVRDDAVEDLAIALVSVEAVIQVGAEESAALRDAERERARDRRRRNRERNFSSDDFHLRQFSGRHRSQPAPL